MASLIQLSSCTFHLCHLFSSRGTLELVAVNIAPFLFWRSPLILVMHVGISKRRLDVVSKGLICEV